MAYSSCTAVRTKMLRERQFNSTPGTCETCHMGSFALQLSEGEVSSMGRLRILAYTVIVSSVGHVTVRFIYIYLTHTSYYVQALKYAMYLYLGCPRRRDSARIYGPQAAQDSGLRALGSGPRGLRAQGSGVRAHHTYSLKDFPPPQHEAEDTLRYYCNLPLLFSRSTKDSHTRPVRDCESPKSNVYGM